jgi:hypothetical protein
LIYIKKINNEKVFSILICTFLLFISLNTVNAFGLSKDKNEYEIIKSFKLSDPLPDQLDQFQNISDIQYQIYDNQYIAQTFIPTLNELTRIKILLRKTIDVSLPDLFVKIENKTRSMIGFSSLKSTELSDQFIWYQFDFEDDISLEIGEIYSIILYSYCDVISGCYEVNCSIYDEYESGQFFISTNGLFWDPEYDVDLCFETYGYNLELNPDLDTIGSLKWTEKVKPGSTIKGNFSILNVGDPNSKLNWRIEENLDWGEININPKNGNDLTPENGELIIQVTIIVPDEPKSTFDGTLEVINSENSNDSETIDISITTKMIKENNYFLIIKNFFKGFNLFK